jgi:nucleotide-binding universal stress UspA family protein
MKPSAETDERAGLYSTGRKQIFDPILVATDFSPRSERAVNYAIEIAKKLQAHLTLLHVVPSPFAIDYTLGGIPGAEWEQVRHRADQKLEAALSRAKIKYDRVDTLVRIGSDLHDEIVSASQQVHAHLVVLSTHGYKGWKYLLFGSDADELLLELPCPVLVVH